MYILYIYIHDVNIDASQADRALNWTARITKNIRSISGLPMVWRGGLRLSHWALLHLEKARAAIFEAILMAAICNIGSRLVPGYR